MVKFIADIGSNHNQDLERIERLIIMANYASCWGVKFQLFKAEKLWHESYKKNIEISKERELPIEFIPKIKAMCHEWNLKFICTPFDMESVDILEPYVDIFKISSFDILRYDLIEKCMKTGKPLIISTGLSNEYERLGLYSFVDQNDYDKKTTILHCVSKYPTEAHECNLHVIEQIRDAGFFAGWSDHTVDEGVLYKAIELGSDIIEFHMDLEDCQGWEFEHGHCWTPLKIKNVTLNVFVGDLAYFCANKFPTDEERLMRADPCDGLRPMKGARK